MQISKVLEHSIREVVENRVNLSKALAIPFVILVADSFLNAEPTESISGLIFLLASIISYIWIAISTHRILLLGSSSVPEWGVYIPSKRDFCFFCYSLALSLLVTVVVMLGLFSLITGFFGVCVALYLWSRLALVFPAIAIDEKFGFSNSWSATDANQLPIFVLVSLVPILVWIVSVAVALIPIVGHVSLVLQIIAQVYTVALLSVSFREIVINEQGE